MKTILIVGGTGFIGYHLVKRCKKKFNVISISTKKPKKERFIKGIKYFYIDISKKKQLNRIRNLQIDYVVNLGGYVDHSNKIKTFSSHFVGVKNLFYFFKNKNIQKFVQIGSSAEYGRLRSPQREKSKCNPQLIYGQAKLQGTVFLKEQFKKFNFPVTILRLYQAYGPKQDINRFIPIVIDACKNGKEFPCSNGKQKRDFTYIQDVVEAIILTLNNKKSSGEIINIGSGKTIKLKDIIFKIVEIFKRGKPMFGTIKMRRDEIIDIKPDIKKAKLFLKWKPKITFDKGLRKTIKFYKKI